MPAGCQVQTWIASSIFLNRWGPASASGDAEALAGLVTGLARHRDAAGRGNRFEADGDVDVVAEHLVLIGHHVAHVDAEAELHGSIGGQVLVALRHHHLHRDRSLDGADDGGKFQQKTVAGVLHQPAAVIEDDRVDRGAMGLERGVCPRLVDPHHAGIAGDVSTNDGCQASFHVPDISLKATNGLNNHYVPV